MIKFVDVKSITRAETAVSHENARRKQRPTDGICVYGTLRTRGTCGSSGSYWGDATDNGLIFQGFVKVPKVAMYGTRETGIPYAVVTHNPDHYIIAECYTARSQEHMDAVMSVYDRIEGSPSFYQRTCVRPTHAVGDVTGDLWMYTVPMDEVEESYTPFNPTGNYSGERDEH